MVKMVFLVHKRADMDMAKCQTYWRETHGPIAAKIPGLKRYIQNHSTVGPDGTDPPLEGVAELWFESPASLETPEAQASIADLQNFLDVDRSPGFVVNEVEIV